MKPLSLPKSKLVRLAGKIKRKFIKGERVLFPRPKHCPFCHAPGHLCLIRWGFYSVNSKRFHETLPGNRPFWIQRFYCKHSARTFSRIPDIFHPRKCHSQEFVADVFDAVLDTGKSVCETAQDFFMEYQTIRWWLKGFSSNRQGKASCFRNNGLNNLYQSSCLEWCTYLWRFLKKTFKGTPETTLIAATKSVLAASNQPLY